jgi:hypothetical protein
MKNWSLAHNVSKETDINIPTNSVQAVFYMFKLQTVTVQNFKIILVKYKTVKICIIGN